MSSVFNGADLYTVADSLLEKAAKSGDKDDAKLAAQYVKLIVDHEQAEAQREATAAQQEADWNRFTLEQQARDRQFKLDCVKWVGFGLITLGGIAIENRYMVSSWFLKTFVQKSTPKV